ncbi:hypothetical protein WJ968_06395 [Achromobacter xylosoxidans]
MDVAGGAYFASQPGSQGGGHIAAADERNRKFVFHNGRIVNRHVPGKNEECSFAPKTRNLTAVWSDVKVTLLSQTIHKVTCFPQ